MVKQIFEYNLNEKTGFLGFYLFVSGSLFFYFFKSLMLISLSIFLKIKAEISNFLFKIKLLENNFSGSIIYEDYESDLKS